MSLLQAIMSLTKAELDTVSAEASASGLDFHKLVVQKVTPKPYEDVTAEERMTSKQALFAYLYVQRFEPKNEPPNVMPNGPIVVGDANGMDFPRPDAPPQPPPLMQTFLILKRRGEFLRAFPISGWEPNLDRINHVTAPVEVDVSVATFATEETLESLPSESKAIIQIVMFLKDEPSYEALEPDHSETLAPPPSGSAQKYHTRVEEIPPERSVLFPQARHKAS